MTTRTILRLIAAILCLAPGILTSAIAGEERTYSFGIVPQQSAVKLAAKWAPVMQHLSAKTGHSFRFETAPNIPEFERRLAQGEYDFAYMNPYHYVVFSESPGYTAVAKQRDKQLKGIMVTRKDSGITELAQLDQSKLAFPSPAAFAASIVTRSNLKQSGADIEPVYVSSHDSVYLSVAKGLYPAGGGIIRTFNNLSDDRKETLRIMWTSDGYTPHAFAAHPDVPRAVIRALATALIDMSDDSSGQQLLGKLNMKALEAAEDGDWDDIRALELETLGEISQPGE